jgi:hypothetical protein
VTEAGFQALKWTEIDAWARLHRLHPKAWELDALAMLDNAWLDVVTKKVVSPEDLLGDQEKDRFIA